MNKFRLYRCSYCRFLKLERKKYFDNNLICNECLKIVPGWTNTIRETLDKIKENT